MATESRTLTDYERQRLDNIRRNEQMMSSLMLKRKAADLTSKPDPIKKPKSDPSRSPKPKSPIIVIPRRSLRTRGIPPSEKPTAQSLSPTPKSPPTPRRAPLVLDDLDLIDAINKSTGGGSESGRVKSEDFDPRSELGLRSDNVARVVSERIMNVKFLPFVDRMVVAVGDKGGRLGFWDVDFSEKGDGEGDGIYVYRPHSSPISGICVHPFSPRKIFTSSYDGLIRLMDVENVAFNIITSCDYQVYSMCQWPQDINSLYIGEGGGMLKAWDERAGKVSSFWDLHDVRINTIDFNTQNVHLMTTSSSDGLACIWDLRSMKKDKPDTMKLIGHNRAVQSSYFSPSGKCLATTSLDDNVRIASGANFDDISMVSHNNWTGRWLSTFRAIWGWDDSYLFIGNMKRAIDVISTGDATTTALESEEMTSIPCRFAAHPYQSGHLAGATSGGKVFLWTRE